MADKTKAPVTPVKKPFLRGNITDERTWKNALGIFGILVITAVMTFLVCSSLSMDPAWLRAVLNMAVELVVLMLFFHNAIGRGAEAVARGEILWQKQEKGREYAASEKAMCFHSGKGYLTAVIGTLPILICAVILALTAQRQTTTAGTLPGWMDTYRRREEIGGALVAYTASTGLGLEDVLRMIVRISLMPFVAMVGAENRDGMLLLERLSPLLVLLPAGAYGTGYLQGIRERSQIHTGIAESNRKRVRREKKARKARAARNHGPEQLN